MSKSKGIQLGAMLAAMLILSLAFMQTVIAQEQVTSRIDIKEQEIKQNLTLDKDSQKNLEKAEKIRKEMDIAVKKDIKNSLQNIKQNIQVNETQDVGILTYTSISLGTDYTFYTADTGDKGTSTWGLAPWFYGSNYYLSNRKAEASSVLGPGGYGGASAWSWAGKQFYVTGSGSRTANIRMSGHLWGLTSAFAGGTSNVEINLVLWDGTTGTKYSTPIYSKSEGGVGWTEVNTDFGNGVAVVLQSGHYYTALLEVITEGAVYGVGEAGSDFGRFDGDYSGEGAWYNSITIDF